MSDASASQTQLSPPEPAHGAISPQSRGPSAMQIAIVVAILGFGVVLTALTSDVTRVSEPGVRIENGDPYLPAQIGEWKGSELQALSPEEKAILPEDTLGVRRLYHDAAGNEVFCSIVLSGSDVTSIHRPELCLPGQGWQLTGAEHTESVAIGDATGGELRVMRMNAIRPFGNGTARYIFVYWFVGKGRTTPYHWQRILWTTRDRVLQNRNHRWAYILINAPVVVQTLDEMPAAEKQTMRLIAKFVHDIYPEMVSR
jgi:EpsI family protein